MSVRGTREARRGMSATAVLLSLTLGVAGCAEFSELISFDSAAERALDAKAKADKASLWEMTLMAGRYGVMLDQAREILNLPEPKETVMFPSDAPDDQGQRKALADYQVRVTQEFLTDAARACKKRRVPANVRTLACKEVRKVPAELRVPVAPEMSALEVRNDQVGNVITPWWDAVCALAPKPKDGDVPACIME
jgi:hypothetical protein